jgi:N-acetylneuraminic acid mutarotase
MLIVAFACEDSEVAKRSYPVIDTEAVTEVDETGATLNATILDVGDGISDHGFVYDDLPYPDVGSTDRISLGQSLQKGPFSARVNRNLRKNAKYFVRSYAIANGDSTVVYGQTVEFTSLGGSAPTISDFFPKEGTILDTVVIVGTGYSDVIRNQSVRIGKMSATIVKANSDSLWCIVPEETPAGENDVVLYLGQYTVTAEKKFYLLPIVLSGFSPASVSYGDTVTITGTNFPVYPESYKVNILGKESEVLSVSPTELVAVISDDVVESETLISITVGAQNLESAGTIVLKAPVITSFTPTEGTGNTEIEIKGENFSPIAENNIVEINDTELTIVSVSETTLRAKVPPGIPPGVYALELNIAGRTIVISSDFEIIRPVITSVSPLNGTWGNPVTIIGENFSNNAGENIVRFDNVQAVVLSATSNEIVAAVPDNLLTKNSEVSVQVTSVDNLIATEDSPFILSPPEISSFTPDQGKSGTSVTIIGSNFNPVPSNQIVKFGDKQAKVISATGTQLTVELPPSLADSDVNIQIDVAEQSATSNETFHLISPWRRISDFPDIARSHAVAFSLGQHGYVTLGTQGALSLTKPCWRYDPSSDTWESVHSFHFYGAASGGSYTNQIAFTIGDNAFVGLGIALVGNAGKEMARYSPADDDWFKVADFAGGAVTGAVAYSINGRGYVTSGEDRNRELFFQTWEYRDDTDSWTRKADFPGRARLDAVGFSIDNKAYMATGRNTYYGEFYNDLWVYDPSLDDWTQLTPMPGTPRWQATAFSIQGVGYVIGGASATYLSDDAFLNDMWRYNPQTNSWTKLEDFPGEPRVSAVVFVIGDKAYFGTGYGSVNGPLKDFWEFDPSKL